MLIPSPQEFAEDWIGAWNARNVEAVLVHYSDDVRFTSPTALRIVPDTAGVIVGKEALRLYWSKALDVNRDLHFTLIDVFAGVDSIALLYMNQRGGKVVEVLTFQDGLVTSGCATHLWTAPA